MGSPGPPHPGLFLQNEIGGLKTSATIFACDPERVALPPIMSKPQGFRPTLVKKGKGTACRAPTVFVAFATGVVGKD